MIVLAHFGHIVSTLPFFAPAIVLPLGLLVLRAVDRRRSFDDDEPDGPARGA